MEHRGASVIVLVFIVASGKLYRDADGLSTGGKLDHLFNGVDSQDVAIN
jgi:hypothetical protein